MKKIYTVLLFSLGTLLYCQVGINTANPDPNSLLELKSDNKGLLIPRITLVSITDPAPLSVHVKGMLIYNKSAFGSSVSEGFYYNDGTQWVRVNKASSQLISFNTNDPNESTAVFSPPSPLNPENIYVSSVNGSFWKYDAASQAYISYQPDPATEWYLTGSTTDAASNKNNAIYRTGEVGIGSNSDIEASAMLDVNSKTKGFLPPRMTQLERDAIVLPAAGLVIYCTDCNNGSGCLVYNYGTPDNPVWECLGQPKGSIVSIDCPGSSIHGNYIKDVANTAANTVQFKIDNNTFSPIVNNFTNYVTLSGASAGLTVSAPTPAQPVTINPGESAILTYTISGTPTLSGDFKARFAGNGLICEKTGTVLASSVIPDCANAFVYGMTPLKYLKSSTTYTGGKIRIPYTAAQDGITYTAQTVTLPSGLTLTRSAGTFSSPSGYIEYTIGGTYTGGDCTSVTADIEVVAGQTCNVVIGANATPYKSGSYAASSNGYANNCGATTGSMTDSSYSTGWASPNATANQWVEITFPNMSVKQVVVSGGPVSCWGGNAAYVSYYANAAGLQLEYWNGTAWVGAGAVPALYQDNITTIDVSCNAITTTKIRIRNNNAQWWGLGTFYAVGYWDSQVTPPSLNCTGSDISLSPNNTLTNGQSYTGTVKVDYSSTLAGDYAAETVSKSGLTLTRAAGTMVNGNGSITYNVSGTYTGPSFTEEVFPISLMGASCEVSIGAPMPFKTGSYSATSAGYPGAPACPATQASMTDDSFTTGWASPNTTANQDITIDFGMSKTVKKIAFSGGAIGCWGGNAAYVSSYANIAGLVLEYWNGTAWVNIGAVPTVSQTSVTIYTLTSPVTTTKIRVRNNTAQWWGLGTFYPFTY